MRMMMIHMAITREVLPGREEEFERRIHEFFHDADAFPGTRGAYLIRPVRPDGRTYGILRSFDSEQARQEFYDSPLYAEWSARVGELVEGGPERRELHGLEAFFRSEPGQEPPAWKMAIVTWLGVNPAVYIFANGVPKIFGALPPLIELLVVNAFVVALLTWVLMPLLTRALRVFLQPAGGS